jgi:hypothetical protein
MREGKEGERGGVVERVCAQAIGKGCCHPEERKGGKGEGRGGGKERSRERGREKAARGWLV